MPVRRNGTTFVKIIIIIKKNNNNTEQLEWDSGQSSRELTNAGTGIDIHGEEYSSIGWF